MTPTVPSLPAACADCMETVQFAQPGAALQQIATKQFRSVDGKLRFDFGTSSLISDPTTQIRVLLDHLTMEARILSAGPQIPGAPAGPPVPPMPSSPYTPPNVNVVQLGKSIIDGMEAEGVSYIFQVLDPLRPPSIASWEVWTSTELQLPLITKTIGAFGQRVNVCKCTAMPVPDSLFQIPPGYTIIDPLPIPSIPSAPALPSAPNLTSPMPATPPLPNAPSLPPTPSLPTPPALPSTPTLPSTPSLPTLPKWPKF